MTDGVNGPAEGAAASEADNRTVVDPNANSGSNGVGADWVAGLEADNRTLVEAKKWTSPNDGLKAYRELEAHASKALTVPGENATAEDWNKFYGRLGRPETADKYELKVDRSTLPADMPYDETTAVEFRNWAHEAGLNTKQAQTLHDKYVGNFAKAFTDNVAKVTQEQEAAHRELVAKWGDANSDGYKREVELMSRAARNLGLAEDLAKGGLLTPDGGVRSSKLALALARVGKELFSEDSFATGDGGILSNPFAKDTLNLTEQGKLVRDDPNKARALIRAAGGDPKAYDL